jgi:hypothetical protein
MTDIVKCKVEKKVEVTMINEKDGYAMCDVDDLAKTLEKLTGKKLEEKK